MLSQTYLPNIKQVILKKHLRQNNKQKECLQESGLEIFQVWILSQGITLTFINGGQTIQLHLYATTKRKTYYRLKRSCSDSGEHCIKHSHLTFISTFPSHEWPMAHRLRNLGIEHRIWSPNQWRDPISRTMSNER